ncbi:hypothetical protein CFPG_688 [Candidatus Azobacteroides pseudotrichonymphae genomovar. CFP2]|uniref:Uncharacterized protein n=1 Tax=Azobacteroides pseudotrichonymphae genomovar. CFP2 TaxID=511995 RepID=B6YRX9_AZOPC|nr:hypothetical protein CFPG_688 [Candidatus Azobacteroides pseudotrichonymphae genomovar. CFP2]
MAFAVELSRREKKDHREYIKAGSPLNKKIAVLLSLISIDPRGKISRIGNPEQLKHYERREGFGLGESVNIIGWCMRLKGIVSLFICYLDTTTINKRTINNFSI